VFLAVLYFDAWPANEMDPSAGESMLANWQFATASFVLLCTVWRSILSAHTLEFLVHHVLSNNDA